MLKSSSVCSLYFKREKQVFAAEIKINNAQKKHLLIKFDKLEPIPVAHVFLSHFFRIQMVKCYTVILDYVVGYRFNLASEITLYIILNLSIIIE